MTTTPTTVVVDTLAICTLVCDVVAAAGNEKNLEGATLDITTDRLAITLPKTGLRRTIPLTTPAPNTAPARVDSRQLGYALMNVTTLNVTIVFADNEQPVAGNVFRDFGPETKGGYLP